MDWGIVSVGLSVADERRPVVEKHLPAAPTSIPARLSEPSVVHAPPIKQDGSNRQAPTNRQGELVSASTLQSRSSPQDETMAAAERYLSTAKSPAQIAEELRNEAMGDLAVAKTRLVGANEKLAEVSKNPYHSFEELGDATANVKNKEWAVEAAKRAFEQADLAYRTALADEAGEQSPVRLIRSQRK